MATTGYTSTGAWFSSANGLDRLHGDIVYSQTRTNNRVTFTNTYARIKHVRESGDWVTIYYAAGWSWQLYVTTGTGRGSGSDSGTASVNEVQNGAAHGFYYDVSAGTTSITGRVGAEFSGDSRTYTGSKTLSFSAAAYPIINSQSSDTVEKKSARVIWTASPGSNCTFSTMHIQYGETTGYGSTITGRPEDGNYTLTGLDPNTEYHWRMKATNGAGRITYGSDKTFTTKKRNLGLSLLMMD